MVMTREEFSALLTQERLKFTLDVLKGGVDDYLNPDYYSPTARRDHTKSLSAGTRNAHMIGRAKRAILELPDLGIRYKRIGHRDFFIIADRAWLTFKKLDENMRPSNYPTKQNNDILTQNWPTLEDLDITEGVQLTLWDVDKIPSMANVFGGYISNEAETEYEYCIVCPNGAENAWDLPLKGEEIKELSKSSPETVQEEVLKRIRKRQRVKIRDGIIKESSTNEE